MKAFSSSTTNKEERVSCEENDDVQVERISGFVTCVVEREWRLACVLQLSPVKDRVKVTLLHPPRPSNSFRYPKSEHIVTVTVKDILTVVDPWTRTGRVYTLLKKEMKAATEIFSSVQ